MSTKITQLTLASITPTGKRHFIRDTSLKGFGIEVSAKGKASYFVEARRKGASGSPVRTTIGSIELVPLAEARTQAKAALLMLSQGQDPRFAARPSEALPDTLGAAFNRYIADKRHGLKASTVKDYRKAERKLSDWRNLPLTQLTESMVIDRYNTLLDMHSTAYANKILRHLGAVVGAFSDKNPVNVLTKRKIKQESAIKERYLEPEQIATLIQFHNYHRQSLTLSLIRFYLLTGCRLNEALNLRWADISDDEIIFRETKNKKDLHFPLVEAIKKTLPPRREPTDRVFILSEGQFRRRLEIVVKQVGFTFTAHDLRRTFANHISLMGFQSSEIGVAMNHSAKGTTDTHYLGARRRRMQLIRDMVTDLAKQYETYSYGYDGSEGKTPKDWLPPDMILDQEFSESMTPEDWADYEKASKQSQSEPF